jgi:hypothetical protein
MIDELLLWPQERPGDWKQLAGRLSFDGDHRLKVRLHPFAATRPGSAGSVPVVR